MNTIKILSKLSKEEYLNRDHKVILLILWDQFLSPNDKSCLTPSEIEKLGLYKSTKLQTTLKELVEFEFVENTKGKYQITPKFQFLLSQITYKEYREMDDISNVKEYTINKVEQYLDEQLLTQSLKDELYRALKVTSNQNKTLLSFMKEWFGDIEGHKKFNELNEYINTY